MNFIESRINHLTELSEKYPDDLELVERLNDVIGCKNYFEQQILALGKELLKHKKEIYKTTMSDIAVQTKEFMIPVSEIIKAFDTLGISLESKTEF